MLSPKRKCGDVVLREDPRRAERFNFITLSLRNTADEAVFFFGKCGEKTYLATKDTKRH